MNRAELITVASERSGASKVSIEKSLDAILETIKAELVAGGEVRLSGFGLFDTVKREERPGTNPKTGEKITIASATKVRFSAFKDFKEAINK